MFGGVQKDLMQANTTDKLQPALPLVDEYGDPDTSCRPSIVRHSSSCRKLNMYFLICRLIERIPPKSSPLSRAFPRFCCPYPALEECPTQLTILTTVESPLFDYLAMRSLLSSHRGHNTLRQVDNPISLHLRRLAGVNPVPVPSVPLSLHPYV